LAHPGKLARHFLCRREMDSIPPAEGLSRLGACHRRGLSLVELLGVVSIIGLLAAFAVPAFNSIGQARGVAEAAYQISAAVELARAEAIARRTYVWMGLHAGTNSVSKDLRVGIMFGRKSALGKNEGKEGL
jgi:prepilin-type N-terminal cleavage/methylation domain-containing protein